MLTGVFLSFPFSTLTHTHRISSTEAYLPDERERGTAPERDGPDGGQTEAAQDGRELGSGHCGRTVLGQEGCPAVATWAGQYQLYGQASGFQADQQLHLRRQRDG